MYTCTYSVIDMSRADNETDAGGAYGQLYSGGTVTPMDRRLGLLADLVDNYGA